MRIIHLFPLLAIPASIFACAAHGNDDGSSESGSAITGSLAVLQACSAASTYSSDGPNDFDVPLIADIPASLQQEAKGEQPGLGVGHFTAPSVGDVYVLSAAYRGFEGAINLYDRNGTPLATGFDFGGGSGYEWLSGVGLGLDCTGTPYNVNEWNFNSSSSSSSGWSSSSSSSSSGGDDDGGTVDSGE